MSGGDLRCGRPLRVRRFQGIQGLPSGAARGQPRAAPNLPAPITARVARARAAARAAVGDLGGRVIAGRFDSGELSDWLVGALDGRLEADERVGVPAVLGLRSADETWQELETRLGRTVFEVATLPPSIPGIRLFDALAQQLREAGTRIVLGVRAVGARTNAGRIEAIDVVNATGSVSHPTGAVVLASGGFASGGLELDSFGVTRETVFDLPLIGVPAVDRVRFAPGYFDEQPLATAGVATDDLHASGRRGWRPGLLEPLCGGRDPRRRGALEGEVGNRDQRRHRLRSRRGDPRRPRSTWCRRRSDDRPHPRFARSLRQVHDLRVVLSRLAGHTTRSPARNTSARRPSATAVPDRLSMHPSTTAPVAGSARRSARRT